MKGCLSIKCAVDYKEMLIDKISGRKKKRRDFLVVEKTGDFLILNLLILEGA